MGFEPMKELPLYTLSKRAPSTTRPSLPSILFKIFFKISSLILNTKYFRLRY